MTFTFVAVPASLATKSGAAHKGRCAAIERRLGDLWLCRPDICNGKHVIKLASPLWGGDAERATIEAFFAAC